MVNTIAEWGVLCRAADSKASAAGTAAYYSAEPCSMERQVVIYRGRQSLSVCPVGAGERRELGHRGPLCIRVSTAIHTHREITFVRAHQPDPGSTTQGQIERRKV